MRLVIKKSMLFVIIALSMTLVCSQFLSKAVAEDAETTEAQPVEEVQPVVEEAQPVEEAPKLSQSSLNAKLFRALKQKQSLAVIKKIVEAGPDINAADNYGRTVLIQAVIKSSPREKMDIVKYFIDLGVDLDVKDSVGESAVIKAKIAGMDDVAKVLEAAGAKFSEEDVTYVESKIKEVADEREKQRLIAEADKVVQQIKLDLKKQADAIKAEQEERAKIIREENATSKAKQQEQGREQEAK